MVLKKLKSLKTKIFNRIARESQYHFLTQKWMKINDVGVMEKLFSSEFFQKQVLPLEPDLLRYKRILVLAPHQDDESIGCGGLMKKIADLGAVIHVLYTTDGSQANLGLSLEESVQLRNKEAEKALAKVGASYDQLAVNNTKPELTSEHLSQFAEKVINFDPDLILAPWPFDFPVKHRLTNHMLYLVRKELVALSNIEIWGYQVHNHLYPNIVVDITGQIDIKKEMIDQFESQNSNFKDYTHLTLGLNAYNSKYKKGARYCELFYGLPLLEYLDFIERFYKGNEVEVYRGERQYIDNVQELESRLNY